MTRSLLLGLVFWGSSSAFPANTRESDPAGRLVIGKPEVIYTDARMPYTMDGSWASLRGDDGKVVFFETAMAKKPYYFRHTGTPDDPLKKELAPFSWNYNGYNHVWPSGAWIQNIYKQEDGTLVGLVHREDLFPGNGRKDHGNSFFIGLGNSTDGGLHWKYLGDVIATRANGTKDAGSANIGGVPYLIVDGYLYLYFNEHDGPKASDSRYLAVARTSLDELTKAMARGQAPSFKKYAGGRWSEDGMTGLASEIIPSSRCRNQGDRVIYDFHSDATFCKPLGRYLITVQTHGGNTLLLYSSTNALDWRLEATLDDAPNCMLPYSSFISFDPQDAADGHDVGEEFFLYYTRKPRKDYNNDSLCRIGCSVKATR